VSETEALELDGARGAAWGGGTGQHGATYAAKASPKARQHAQLLAARDDGAPAHRADARERVIDRRTMLGRQLATWRENLVRDLGGNVSTQQSAVIDLAVRTRLLLDSIDAWLLEQPSLVNRRKRALLPAVRERQLLAMRLRATWPFTRDGEGSIAEHLNATVAKFPELLLRSYPKLGDPEYSVKLTLESKDQAYVEAALAHLLSLLPKETVVRVVNQSAD
jgi:hypothetical protein